MSDVVRELCPSKGRTIHKNGAWCFTSKKGITFVCISDRAHKTIGLSVGDRVSIMEMSDGSYIIAKSASGRRLCYTVGSRTGRISLPLLCIPTLATIKDGVAKFPAGTFFERSAK